MRKILSDLWDITVALIQTVAALSYAKIAAMTRSRKTALCIFLLLLAMCVIRLINWHNVGGEVLLLAAVWVYLRATRTEDVINEDHRYDTDV